MSRLRSEVSKLGSVAYVPNMREGLRQGMTPGLGLLLAVLMFPIAIALTVRILERISR